MMVEGPVPNRHQKEIAELVVKSRLPVIYSGRDLVEAGGLMSYGVSVNDLDRRAATYVDKILKGRKPAELPVEQPTKFEFIINLKAAKQIGLMIPPNVLVRADRVNQVRRGASVKWKKRRRGEEHEEKKITVIVTLCAMLFALSVSADAQQTGKSPALVSWIQALLPVARSSWSHFGKSCANLAGLKEKTLPSSTGLPSKSLSACLSWRQTWFNLRLI